MKSTGAATPIAAALRSAWAGWKIVAHRVGNFQARVVLSLFYFVVVPPFALGVKLLADPLRLRAPRGAGFWTAHPVDASTTTGREQF